MRRAVLAGAAAALAVVGTVAALEAGTLSAPADTVRPVTQQEAVAAVRQVARLTEQGRVDEVCREAHARCEGLSGSAATSAYRPGPDRPPSVLCTFALPGHLRATAWGDGHVVVVEGRDAQDRYYVSQQLVVREGRGTDAVVRVHEPAYWYGIAYDGFGGRRGSVWSAAYGEGPTDEASARRQTGRAVRSCQDTAGYLAEVAPA